MQALILALAALAHEEDLSTSRLVVEGREVTWVVRVGTPDLQKVLKFPAPVLDLTKAQLGSMKDEIARYLARGLTLKVNGVEVALEVGPLEPGYEKFILSGEPFIGHVIQEFRFRAPADVKHLRVGVRLFSEVTTKHRAIVEVFWGERKRQYPELRGPGELSITYESLEPSVFRTGGQFVLWGMHHIFTGYDHIAFLLALLLGARRLGELVKIVTSFTVAHSVTLFLAAMKIVRLDPWITESLIAASIVYVAVENLLVKDASHRWVLTFGFGLIHGLGFSSVLADHLTDGSWLVVQILSFNVGVELGQLAILSVAFPLLVWLRRGEGAERAEARQRRLVWIGSVPVLLFGLGWLVDRLFRLEFMPL